MDKLIDENKKKIKDSSGGESTNTGGFLIEEKVIGGKIYLTFSVSEYLNKMKKPLEVKKDGVPLAVIKIVQPN